ncbi:MAG TPA: hypothetical protein VM925_02830 [Labilithrix sp.]|nr:hypothetical protein [Labilithrix sp.]
MFKRSAIATVFMLCSMSFAQERDANACWPGPCPEPRLLPESGATLPQNVPGFPFRPGGASSASDDGDAGAELETVTLKDAVGNLVPTSTRSMRPTDAFDRFIVPSAPLASGSYSLELVNPCAESKRETRSFTIGAPRSFPTQIGTLRAIRSATGTVMVEAPARCVATRKADSVSIAIDPTPEFAAFQGVAIVSVFVDGKSWKGPVTKYRGGGWPTHFDPFVVYAFCDQSSGVSPGRHVVEVRAHLEGAPSDPAPATIEIELKCAE